MPFPNQVCRPEEFVEGDFKSEKEFQKFVESNLEDIFLSITDRKIKKHESQKRVGSGKIVRFPNLVLMPLFRIDIFIEDEDGDHWLVELKNKDDENAIVQLMKYACFWRQKEKKNPGLIYLTPKVGKFSFDIITQFNLPIRIAFINKDFTAIPRGDGI